MNVAITGASGFIGSSLAAFLKNRGYGVIPVVRNASAPAPDLQATGLVGRTGDVTDPASLRDAFAGAEVVIHLAALFNNPEAGRSAYMSVNVDGTRNVLEAAASNGIRRVIHCSTIGVVTDSSPPFSESSPYAPPNDDYERSKCEAERLALAFHGTRGVGITVIRPAQVYGPGDRSKAKFYRMVRKGIIVNPGRTLKHLIYIDDLVRGIEMILHGDRGSGDILILAGRQPIPLRELIGLVARELGVGYPRMIVPAMPVVWLSILTEGLCRPLGVRPPLFRRSLDFFTRSVACDVRRARDVLGFTGEVDIATGVARTAAWYRENGLL